MRFRYVVLILVAGLAFIGGGQFRIAKIVMKGAGGSRTTFRVCLPGRTPDVFAMTDGDFMCRIFHWYGLRELDGGFGVATDSSMGETWPTTLR